MPRPSFGSFADMPVGLRRFLFSKEFSSADRVLEETYHIPKDVFEQVGDVIMDIIFNDASLAEGIASIRAVLVPAVLTDEAFKPFLVDLVRMEFWPIRDLFGEELSFWLAEQQIGTGGWPMQRVLLKPLTYSSAATELAQRAGFSIMGAQLRERLRDLIVSKIKGVRIDAQIRETLMRQQDFGGIGLDARQADAAIAALNELLQTVEVLSESEYADWLTSELQKNEKTEPEQTDLSGEDDDPEISAIKTKMKAQPASPPSVLDQAVQQAISQIRDKPVDEYLLRRLQNVVSSRLRDVRSSLELRQILMRDSKVGGVGMTADQANAAVDVVEAAYQASHASIMDDEKKKLEVQIQFQQQKIEERKKREAEEHARWYQEKILAKKQAEERQLQAADQMRKQFAAGMAPQAAQQAASPAAPLAPVDVKEQHLEQKRFGGLVQAVQVGAQPIAQAAAVEVAARPEVKVSVATTPVKPQMDGVVPPPAVMTGAVTAGPKLMGLTGELSELSLTEFRRMAKTPDEAVQKILQKVETLGQESFERRVEGVRAFQGSPLQGSYMALVAESFRTGKPVAALADEKRAKGENTLSPQEISAILSLNSKLHF